MDTTKKNLLRYVAISTAAVALLIIAGMTGRCSRNGQVKELQETNIRLGDANKKWQNAYNSIKNANDELTDSLSLKTEQNQALTDSLSVVTEQNQALTDSLTVVQKRLADCEAKKKPCPCRPATKPATRKPAPAKPAPAKPAPVEQSAGNQVTINNNTSSNNNTVIIGNNNTVVINEQVKAAQETKTKMFVFSTHRTRIVTK